MKKLFIASFFLFIAAGYGQQIDPLLTSDFKNQEKWVDSIMDKLTLKQKIGQLFMIQAYSNKDEKHTKEIKKIIKKNRVGGLIFMQGTPEKQAELTNEFQATSKTPLLIGFDGEWGLNMRLKILFVTLGI